MKTCVLLDYNNMMHRSIHLAYSEQKKMMDLSRGEYTRIPDVYTLWKNHILESIFKYVSNFDCDRLIVAIDSKNSWRKKVYSGYKSKRKSKREESPVDYDEFFKVSDIFLENLKTYFPNIVLMKVEECETDDIIAVLCREELKDFYNIIVSTDSDFNQLLSLHNVRRYNPLYSAQSFVEVKNPKKELAIKVICGDSSDEVPNILVMEGEHFEGKTIGCGDKTAEDIILHGVDSAYVVKKVLAKYKNLTEQNIIEKVKGNVYRNNVLINFDYIPVEYRQRILNVYRSIESGRIDIRNAMNFLVKNNMRGLYENFNRYVPALMKLGT